MSSTLEDICIHGKELLSKCTVHQEYRGNNLALKQMFGTSEKLIVGQSNEIFGVTPINWEDSSCKNSPQYRTLDTIDGEPMDFEWNIFPRFTTLQLINRVHEFMTKMGDPSQLKRRII